MPYSRTNSSFVIFQPDISLFEYVEHRHQLWRASRGLREPPAMDPVFRKWVLTNNWRELDRTTCYVINEVMPRYEYGSPEQLLEIACFRSLGKIDTDVAIIARFGTWNEALVAGYDRLYEALPPRPLTGAYARIVGTKRALKAGFLLMSAGWHERAIKAVNEKRWHDARDWLAEGTYLGLFVATQILYDLTWQGGPMSLWWEGDLRLGVGAAHGLSLVTGRECVTMRRGNPEVDLSVIDIKELDRIRNEVIINQPPLINGEDAEFTIRELEQVLCEYSRVCRILRFGRVGPLRSYIPNPEPFALAPGWSAQ